MKKGKKSKNLILISTKETQEARKKRVSSGPRFRPTVFEGKRRKLRAKATGDEERS